MKKIICLLIIAVLISAAVSCSHENADPLEVFSGGFCAEILLECEESECKISYDSIQKSAEFLSPEELTGYKLRLDNGKAYLSFGETETEVSDYAGVILFICDDAFSKSTEDITKITAAKAENRTVTTVQTEKITYELSFDGSPISVSGEHEGRSFCMTFLSFERCAK